MGPRWSGLLNPTPISATSTNDNHPSRHHSIVHLLPRTLTDKISSGWRIIQLTSQTSRVSIQQIVHPLAFTRSRKLTSACTLTPPLPKLSKPLHPTPSHFIPTLLLSLVSGNSASPTAEPISLLQTRQWWLNSVSRLNRGFSSSVFAFSALTMRISGTSAVKKARKVLPSEENRRL